jgi:hypothetical protein
MIKRKEFLNTSYKAKKTSTNNCIPYKIEIFQKKTKYLLFPLFVTHWTKHELIMIFKNG